MAQQRARCPMAEQTALKSAGVVGTVGGFAQSRSATPSTSVAQHCSVLVRPEQRGAAAWRRSASAGAGAGAGIASATAAKRVVIVMRENCILAVVDVVVVLCVMCWDESMV